MSQKVKKWLHFFAKLLNQYEQSQQVLDLAFLNALYFFLS